MMVQETFGRIIKKAEHEGIELYQRDVDAGHGTQDVVVEDGIIKSQKLTARSGYYTGDGNPELVGKEIDNVKRRYHLRKVRLSEQAENALCQELLEGLA